MTIRELKDRVPYVKGIVKLPSPKGLREADIPIIADTDDSLETCLGEECRAVVYMNGLVLYTRGKYATVFRLHKCRETYGKGSARSFTEVPYQFMLMLEGEHRLEYNQDKKEADWNTSAELLEEEYGYGLPGRGDILDELVTDEIMEFVFSILTERQKMVVYMFYFEQKKQADIAELLGIQRVTVATILRTALKTLRDRYDQTVDIPLHDYLQMQNFLVLYKKGKFNEAAECIECFMSKEYQDIKSKELLEKISKGYFSYWNERILLYKRDDFSEFRTNKEQFCVANLPQRKFLKQINTELYI